MYGPLIISSTGVSTVKLENKLAETTANCYFMHKIHLQYIEWGQVYSIRCVNVLQVHSHILPNW